MKRPRPRAERVAPITDAIGILSFHPQRGAIVTREPVVPMLWEYRGGKNSDWREVARVEVILQGRRAIAIPGQPLPKGFLWGDLGKQVFGMGGGHVVFGPREHTCADCGARFPWPAKAQKELYEDKRAHTDVIAKRCRACARARGRLETARATYAAAVEAAKGATTATPHLELARATLAVLEAGGRANLDRAIAACRKARRLGAVAKADALEASLVARRGR